MVPRFGGYRMCCDDRHHASIAASAATGTGFTAGEQVDLTDVAPSGAKQSFAPAAESFSMAVSEQAMRMRVMDGVFKALRMRINGVMEASAAIPLAERRRQFPSRR